MWEPRPRGDGQWSAKSQCAGAGNLPFPKIAGPPSLAEMSGYGHAFSSKSAALLGLRESQLIQIRPDFIQTTS